MNMTLTIGYLYPEYMNIYGDTGNIITLIDRAKQRNIEVTVQEISKDTFFNKNKIDIYFFGGGQDQQQIFVSQHIQKFKDIIKNDIESGAVALTICGGYQLFGKFYRPFNGEDIKGLEIFNIETHASCTRMINNIAIKMDQNLIDQINQIYLVKSETPDTLVGFENHSGQTKLIDNSTPLGQTIFGFGNNSTRLTEGCLYKNAFGTYMHGSLLPKNPHFADLLLYKAIKYRYQEEFKLEMLDDELEYTAHKFILQNYK